MTDLKALQDQLEAELGQFLRAVQTDHVVDRAAFERVDRDAEELARVLKECLLVPKSLLHDLRVSTKILRAEAPYLEEGRNDLIEMADKLEMTFDLILKGECYTDRVPGVPRIF